MEGGGPRLLVVDDEPNIDTDGEEHLLGLGLRLGETITVTVSRAIEHTDLGITPKSRYSLLSVDLRSVGVDKQ